MDDTHAFEDPAMIVSEIVQFEGDNDVRFAQQRKYRQEKIEEIGKEIEVKSGTKKRKWTVIEDLRSDQVPFYSDTREMTDEAGVRGFDFSKKDVVSSVGQSYKRVNLLNLLIHLWPGNWLDQLKLVNKLLLKDNKERRNNRNSTYTSRTHQISQYEFWTFFGILLAARLEGRKGNMWDSSISSDEGFRRKTNFSQYLTKKRFLEIRKHMSHVFRDDTPQAEGDDWAQIMGGIRGFNENRRRVVKSPKIKVLDETMSAFRPRTTKTGNLPHLSFILRKPEPLGTEFKSVAAADLGTY